MKFYSILYPGPEDRPPTEPSEAPAYFTDLNLDQLVEAITFGRQDYNLHPFFHVPLRDLDAISYRQAIARDLESRELAAQISAFSQKMTVMRRYLALSAKLYNTHHRAGWFLETTLVYCDAISGLVENLSAARLRAPGMLAFQAYLNDYAGSEDFRSLRARALDLKAKLSTIRYCIIIKDSTIRVQRYENEIDYSTQVENTFEKFKQGAVKDYRSQLPAGAGMNHVEAQILTFVARLFPEIFTALDDFCRQSTDFVDRVISDFDREVQFYLAYLEHISRLKRVGLRFCYPQIGRDSKDIFDYDGFDLALATKHVNSDLPVVPNDFYLKDKERVIVVSGPNQGGKTTFARTFGQLHYLAGLGCPVPGREARLYLIDNLYTHFEREENIANLRGKLQDDLIRIHSILNRVTPRSILVMNEIFASTTLQDAVFLSERIMERIIRLDLLCVWVTFIDELASFSEQTVSMVSTITPENPAVRTYKVVRKPADGLAYALSIAEKYRLTYGAIKERIST